MVMKKIAEGAEADVYETEVLGFPAIMKDRIEKGYRQEVLDKKIRKERTRSEAKIIARASDKGVRVPKVLLVEGTKLYIEFLDGDTLNHIMDKKDSELVPIIEEAGRQLAMLHSNDIAHGDYTPANLLLDDKNELWVIDFGLGEFTNSIEEKALDVLLMKRSISKKLYEKFKHSYLYYDWKGTKHVLSKLEDIEKRGRYQTRSLAVIKS